MTLSGLADIRAAVARHARTCGLPENGVADLVVIANELATNVIRHGGGTGELWLWCHAGGAVCQVTDHGPGMPHDGQPGKVRAAASSLTGRGIWMVRELSEEVDINTGPAGTTVTVVVSRDRRRAAI